jgi:hypothetical protein
MRCISIVRSLYFKIFSASFLITFSSTYSYYYYYYYVIFCSCMILWRPHRSNRIFFQFLALR